MQLTEAWHVVALASSLEKGGILGVTLHGNRFAVWNDERGNPIAAETRCPHKGAALDRGSVVNGLLRCPYHGWQFDGQGKCVEIPSSRDGASIPLRAVIGIVPCQKAHGFIWLWHGSGEPAPLPAVTHIPAADDSQWRCIEGERIWQADWVRALEGFLDISHVPFVHKSTFGAAVPNELYTSQESATDDSIYGLVETNPLQPLLGELAPKSMQGNGEQHFHLWLANLMLVRAEVADFKIYLCLATVPLGDGQTKVLWRHFRSFLKTGSTDNVMRSRLEGFLAEDQAAVESMSPAEPDILPGGSDLLLEADSMSLALRKILLAKGQAGLLK